MDKEKKLRRHKALQERSIGSLFTPNKPYFLEESKRSSKLKIITKGGEHEKNDKRT